MLSDPIEFPEHPNDFAAGDPRGASRLTRLGPAKPRSWSRVSQLVALMILCCNGCAGLPTAPPAPAAPAAAQAGGATIVAIAPPSPPPITLPKFLGLDIAYGGVTLVGQRVRNRLGTRFPGLEARPPVRSLTDPANTSETASPAVKAAAQAKAEQDEVPQKAKAIKYLASLGCGKCYPDTEKALLAALDDCNEMIRYETVRGLRKSLGDSCNSCRENSCCSPKLTRKLYEIGYGVTENGCHQESSSRVRRNARLALCGCGGIQPEQFEGIPFEGPSMVGSAVPAEAPDAGAPAADETASSTQNARSAGQANSVASLSLPSSAIGPSQQTPQTALVPTEGPSAFAPNAIEPNASAPNAISAPPISAARPTATAQVSTISVPLGLPPELLSNTEQTMVATLAPEQSTAANRVQPDEDSRFPFPSIDDSSEVPRDTDSLRRE